MTARCTWSGRRNHRQRATLILISIEQACQPPPALSLSITFGPRVQHNSHLSIRMRVDTSVAATFGFPCRTSDLSMYHGALRWIQAKMIQSPPLSSLSLAADAPLVYINMSLVKVTAYFLWRRAKHCESMQAVCDARAEAKPQFLAY